MEIASHPRWGEVGFEVEFVRTAQGIFVDERWTLINRAPLSVLVSGKSRYSGAQFESGEVEEAIFASIDPATRPEVPTVLPFERRLTVVKSPVVITISATIAPVRSKAQFTGVPRTKRLTLSVPPV